MWRRRGSFCGVIAAVLLWSAALTISIRARDTAAQGSAGAQPPGTTAQPGRYLGPGACAAAACHGSMRPVANARSGETSRLPILQTEHTTWAARDLHHRAFEVLSNSVSAHMGVILKIGDPKAAPKCLACHALEPLPERPA